MPEDLDALVGEQDGDTDLVKRLRKALKDQGKEVGQLRIQVQELGLSDKINMAGVSNLKPRQLKALKRELADEKPEDITPELIKEIVDDLGYVVSSQPNNSSDATNPNPDNSQNNQAPNVNPDPNTNPDPNMPDPNAVISAANMMGTENLGPGAGSQNGTEKIKAFSQALANAKTFDERQEIIRSMGPTVGVAHEFDVQ